jgi:hypothetical protein
MSIDGMIDVCSVRLLEGLAGFSSLQFWRTMASEVQVLADTDSLSHAWKVAWVVVWWHWNKGNEYVGCGFVEYSLYRLSVGSSRLDDNGFVEYSLYGPQKNVNFAVLPKRQVTCSVDHT